MFLKAGIQPNKLRPLYWKQLKNTTNQVPCLYNYRVSLVTLPQRQPPVLTCVRYYSGSNATFVPDALSKAIDANDIIKAKAIYQQLKGKKSFQRGALACLISLAAKGTKPHEFDFVAEIVHDMETLYNIKPFCYEYNMLMYCLSRQNKPEEVRAVLEKMRKYGPLPNVYSYNTVLGCYKRSEDLPMALSLLKEMDYDGVPRDTSTYNTLLHFLLSYGLVDTAHQFYKKMLQENLVPDNFTYSTLLKIATKTNDVEFGKAIYNKIERTAKLNKIGDINMINDILLFKGVTLEDLHDMFEFYSSLPVLFPHVSLDIVSFNIMINASLMLGEPARAYRFYKDMSELGIQPDEITYGILMDAEVRLGDLDGAVDLFNDIRSKGFQPTARLLSILVNATPHKNSDKKSILGVFEAVKKGYANGIHLDIKAYNSLLSGLAKSGCSQEAHIMFDTFFNGKVFTPDIATYTNLILAYINDHRLQDALSIYYSFRENFSSLSPDTAFYTILISSLATVDLPPEYSEPYEEDDDDYNSRRTRSPALVAALTLFNDMRQLHIRPNAHCYTSMLYACGRHKDIYMLEQVHKLIKMDLYFDPDTAVYNALMDAYNRSGNGEAVLQIWETLMHASCSTTMIDATTISILMDSCGHNGLGHRASAIWKDLQNRGFSFNTNNYNSYIECLCRSTPSRRGFDKAMRVMRTEMQQPLSKFVDQPRIEMKTINTLLSFARKKNIPVKDTQILEMWRKEWFE
ncbi:hypothetical protein BDF14DRAFT_1729280 [Spinellus fusiger]|nr:hypothetical protein BDF14DRAFT_1729280 [Spinellus fusiger]